MVVLINPLTNVDVTGKIRLCVSGDETGLYMANTAAVVPTEAPFYDYETTLTSIPIFSGTALKPATIGLPQMLPVDPFWDIVFTASDDCEVGYTVFGGGWSTLSTQAVKNGTATTGYSYLVEKTNLPFYVRNSSSSPAKQQYISAIFSGSQLGVIGLDGTGSSGPQVTDLVGSVGSPVSTGRVFGDLSKGLPSTLSLAYKVDKKVGPLSPGGSFGGSLFFATFAMNTGPLSTPVPLLDGLEFSNFDLAVSSTGDFCLLAITGDGAPLLAQFKSDGTPDGSPNMPVGTWNNPGRWVSNPTIVATPGVAGGYSFAFIEMDGGTPSSIQTGTATTAPST